jgi:hypothetical protein
MVASFSNVVIIVFCSCRTYEGVRGEGGEGGRAGGDELKDLS